MVCERLTDKDVQFVTYNNIRQGIYECQRFYACNVNRLLITYYKSVTYIQNIEIGNKMFNPPPTDGMSTLSYAFSCSLCCKLITT